MKIIDKVCFGKSKRYKNQAGFLVLPDCTLARSGILEYSDVEDENGKLIADGKLIVVYRPPEAIKECASQFSNLPLTRLHPESNEVNPDNAKDVVVGSLGQNPVCEQHNDGESYIKCDIIVYDADTIKAIEEGSLEELSAGYETAFREKQGQTQNGMPYEAEQFYLSPNHVALVPRGRCGSECRICDSADVTKINKEKKSMKVDPKCRYLLQIGDSEETVEITPQDAEKLLEDQPNMEVEEITENQIEEVEKAPETDEDDLNQEQEIETETDEDEDDDEINPENGVIETETDDEDKRSLIDEIGGILKGKVDEETWRTIIGIVEKIAYNASETGVDDEDDTITYRFDDGTCGKMDTVTLNHVDALIKGSKKGDSMQSYGAIVCLTSKASKMIGDSFEVADYVKKNGTVDTDSIKKACIHKVMPAVVTTNLRGDSLDRLFNSAYATSKKNTDAWSNDVKGLALASKNNVTDSANVSIAENARKGYLDRMHNGNKEN